MDPSEVKEKKKILLHKAKLAEGVKRYDHMFLFMNQIVDLTDASTDLPPKERCLLGAAFRNYLLFPRKSWHTVISLTQSRHNEFGRVSDAYLRKTGQEISQACTKILLLIDSRLFPSAKCNESKVFYLTLKADFSWYLAEVKGPIEGNTDAGVASNTYLDAQMFAKRLSYRNPYSLALDLSQAEHSYRYLHDPEEASSTIEWALLEALSVAKTRPAVSLLSFEGGIQLISDLRYLKKKIKNKAKKNQAGPSNVQPATLPEAPYF